MTLNGRMTVTTAVACLLAATALLPLFSDALWFVIAIGAVTAVAATGALTRLRPLPVPVCLAAGLAGLVLYLNLIFEARHSLLRVIPTPSSLLRLWDLVGTGMHDANRYAPQVPNLPGLLLLAVGGVGIAAVFADLIAVRLRFTALAGLPLLVLFSVPVMMNASHDQFVTGLVFCLGGAGYLAMLSADGRERIRVWGRLVSLWRSPPRYGASAGEDEPAGAPRRIRGRGQGPDTRALAAAGRRVGLASIVLALCAPLLLPGLHPSKLFSSGPGIGGNEGGGGDSLSLPSAVSQTVTQLHESRPVTMFTYTTNATSAQQADDAEYFRQYVFDTLGDAGWQVDDYSADTVPVASIPGPQGLTDDTAMQTVVTRVSVTKDFPSPGSQPTFLPLPYPALQVYAPGRWLADPDLMVYSTGDPIADRSYTVASVEVDPSRAQLETVPGLVKTANLARDLQLPPAYRSATLEQLADSNTADQTSEFGKVDALANWLSSSQFGYSLNAAPVSSAVDLVNFLTRTKTGFCVQYAYAMTVLTRLLGIPARFVVGYTAGTRLKSGQYVVRNTDAHAWTEVYFPSLGWIRFEPTPAGQGTATPPNYMTSGTGRALGGGANPVVSATAGPGNLKSNPDTSGLSRTRPDSLGNLASGSAAGTAGTPWTAVALAVIAAIVLTFILIATVTQPGRGTPADHPEPARRRRPPATTIAVALTATAALVALALYRLLARTAGLNFGKAWATIGIAFAVTAALALIAPGAARLALRRWRWIRATDDTSRAHAAWAEFHDDLADYGLPGRPSEPPRTLAARITTTLPPPAAEAVTRLARAEERASYAARSAPAGHLHRDGTTARRALAAAARRPTRWRAALFPASTMTALTRVPDYATALIARHRNRHQRDGISRRAG